MSSGRRILNRPVEEFLTEARAAARRGVSAKVFRDWELELEPKLLYDRSGLSLLWSALERVPPGVCQVNFELSVSAIAFRDFYSLQPGCAEGRPIPLGARARRRNTESGSLTTIVVRLPEERAPVLMPRSLTLAQDRAVPGALLLPCGSDFDLLFANQIALLSRLRRSVPRDPRACLAGLPSMLSGRRERAIAAATRAFRRISPSAEVHPTAVVEGSIIEAGARIGAHCVVRCSHIGRDVRLMDGAKVEYSVVGDRSWLMHDLVLYLSVAEEEVFLIHGPYQFSYFQSGSAAFATILMDYRPDGRPISVRTGEQVLEYRGAFLGSVLKPGSKTLGGALLAPGRIVPEGVWLGPEPEQIHRVKLERPRLHEALSPKDRN